MCDVDVIANSLVLNLPFCSTLDLGTDISIEADVIEPLVSAETPSEASAAVQSSRPTSSACSFARRHVTQ